MGAGIAHGLDAHVAVVELHGTASVDYQVHVVIPLNQVETSLLHTDMCLNAIKHHIFAAERLEVGQSVGIEH